MKVTIIIKLSPDEIKTALKRYAVSVGYELVGEPLGNCDVSFEAIPFSKAEFTKQDVSIFKKLREQDVPLLEIERLFGAEAIKELMAKMSYFLEGVKAKDDRSK